MVMSGHTVRGACAEAERSRETYAAAMIRSV